MAASNFINLSNESQTGIITYLRHCRSRYQYFYNIRSNLEVIDRDYYRELDWTKEHQRAQAANRTGDATKFQDVTVPIVMPQVEAFVTYQTSVFLSGHPIFGVVASPEYQDAALALEAVITDEATKGAWKAELIRFFRDVGKYNLGACEVSWDKITVPSYETDISFSEREAKTKEVIWEGNRVKKLDLYNTFWDTQCHPRDVAAFGEYAGYNEMVTRIKLKQLISKLGSDAIIGNIAKAFNSGTPLQEYYIPQINPKALVAMATSAMGGTDWFSWAGIAGGREDLQYKSAYIVTTLYIRLLPSEFGIKAPSPNTPQIWKFIIVNQSVVIYAEKQTNAHDMLPIIFACPNDDDIKYQSKSLANNVQPFQQVATAMMNGMVASLRRSVNDRAIYNPLYIEARHINDSNPAAKIPCKPSAYAGVPLDQMYHSIPYNNDQFPVLMQGSNTMMAFADIVSGQNKAQQGQFVKGNKTQHEYADVMQSANGRSQLASLILEDQFFSPVKQIIVSNILQYQGEDELYHDEKKKLIPIDPIILRNAVFKFKVSDGILPTDKLINADAWQVAMQVLGSSPALGAEYNIAPLFSYLMKTQGADVSPFEKPPEQLQYEQALGAWQQTVMQLMKQNPEMQGTQLPPQPLPEQFGLDKSGRPVNADKKLAEESRESIMDKIMEGGNPAAEQQEQV